MTSTRYNIFVRVLQRPDSDPYPLIYRQVYGFQEGDCDNTLKTFTDRGFVVVYSKIFERDSDGAAKSLARDVNGIVNNSNIRHTLDTKALDDLLANPSSQ